MSAQVGASASQNFTCPTVTGTAFAFTVAVRVTTDPDGTEATSAWTSLEVTAKVVVVVAAEAAITAKSTKHAEKNGVRRHGMEFRDFIESFRFCGPAGASA